MTLVKNILVHKIIFNSEQQQFNNNNNSTTKSKKPKSPKTRIICISENLYQRFHSHARSYYNVESYETILENFLNFYEKNNS